MSAQLALLARRSRRLLADYALLLVLDARSAALQLAQALSALLVATVLLASAWLAGVVAVVGWLLGSGASWPAALSAAALLNVLGAALVLWWARGRFAVLPFAASLRQLRGADPGVADETAP